MLRPVAGRLVTEAAERAAALTRRNTVTSRATSASADVVGGAVHGNSRMSPKLTYLYRLETKSGEYLKTGITSNPKGRYSQGFMSDKYMRTLTTGRRSDMMTTSG